MDCFEDRLQEPSVTNGNKKGNETILIKNKHNNNKSNLCERFNIHYLRSGKNASVAFL